MTLHPSGGDMKLFLQTDGKMLFNESPLNNQDRNISGVQESLRFFFLKKKVLFQESLRQTYYAW